MYSNGFNPTLSLGDELLGNAKHMENLKLIEILTFERFRKPSLILELQK